MKTIIPRVARSLLAVLLLFPVLAVAQIQINQLPSATTPLSGTEAVPIYQGGHTKQVPANSFFPSIIGVPNGGTGCTAPSAACANAIGAAARGANTDITSLGGLTSRLSASPR